MKTLLACLPIALAGLLPSGLCAAAFSSGSTGSDGALNLDLGATAVIQLPPDGILNYTTINVEYGATLTFIKNEFNTPVYLLATSNVVINGSVVVSGGHATDLYGGEGGPGGFDGGNPAAGSEPPGDGYGPGAGTGGTTNAAALSRARAGAYATTTSDSLSNRYGSVLLQPLVGGSGGGGTTGWGGGGGGGAILIASSTSINVFSGRGDAFAAIFANGGYGTGGAGIALTGGSGGAIRLVAPKVSVGGRAGLFASGGPGGGNGRIRVDTLDKSAFAADVGGARFSIGANMTVFPAFNSRLDITEVAGRTIPVGTNATVRIQLPLNSPTNQTVKLRATDFLGAVNLEVVVTPDNGVSQRFPRLFDVGNSNVAETVVNVIIPPDVPCKIHAWSR